MTGCSIIPVGVNCVFRTRFSWFHFSVKLLFQPKGSQRYGEYNVYSTFQSHEPEFDYLKSLEIEEKINKIKWLKRRNASHFLLSTNGGFIV